MNLELKSALHETEKHPKQKGATYVGRSDIFEI